MKTRAGRRLSNVARLGPLINRFVVHLLQDTEPMIDPLLVSLFARAMHFEFHGPPSGRGRGLRPK